MVAAVDTGGGSGDWCVQWRLVAAVETGAVETGGGSGDWWLQSPTRELASREAVCVDTVCLSVPCRLGYSSRLPST